MKKIALSLVFACFTANAFAQDALPASARALDIVQVISQTTDDGSCGFIPMHLVYKDSRGLVHTLDYTIIGSGCSNG
ncbi:MULTISPECIES: DUF2790 domain-containing protein [Pseudomonas]|uniref:DUF2790 domain-containing protein n=1 Tax=Pseudomonas TaxID=286 RepID=UPI0005711002|nr:MULTISPECIES: DUF2790 domain-containing protein [Pseudomonas]MBP2839349.1 DUF2790 domain-containing protein [Pseudomonas sp. PNP]MCK2122748.1 DUF2790 domain-containing protein [Pseudomonas sp. PNPG3]QUN65208.1 DUF2790 domain-containing protein [Pseudomonas sp. JS425]